VHPALALTLFAVLAGLLYLAFRPRRGWGARLARYARVTDRVRVEDALKHLLHAENRGRTGTIESVAGALEVSRSRAVRLLGRIHRAGLVRPDGGDSGYRLTDEGRSYGLRLVRAHRLLERYFADRTGIPAEEWHEEAERREHDLTPDQTDRLAARMGHPRFDPHGDPIPGPGGEIPPVMGESLLEQVAGATLRVVHVEDEPREIFDQLVAAGLAPGLTLRVLRVSPQGLRISIEGREETLEPMLAANVEVAPAGPGDQPVVEPGELRTLADLRVGESAEVLELAPACQGVQRRRLLDLGVVPGTVIHAIMASASGDPLAYDIRGAAIALRRQQARWIRVRPAGTRGAAA